MLHQYQSRLENKVGEIEGQYQVTQINIMTLSKTNSETIVKAVPNMNGYVPFPMDRRKEITGESYNIC